MARRRKPHAGDNYRQELMAEAVGYYDNLHQYRVDLQGGERESDKAIKRVIEATLTPEELSIVRRVGAAEEQAVVLDALFPFYHSRQWHENRTHHFLRLARMRYEGGHCVPVPDEATWDEERGWVMPGDDEVVVLSERRKARRNGP